MEKKKIIRVLIILSISVFYAHFGFTESSNKGEIILDEKKPEVSFARKVQEAAQGGAESYISILSDKIPDKQYFHHILDLTTKRIKNVARGRIVNVIPVPKEEAQKFAHICAKPYYVVLSCPVKGQKNEKYTHKEPIGKVGGQWKVLYINEK